MYSAVFVHVNNKYKKKIPTHIKGTVLTEERRVPKGKKVLLDMFQLVSFTKKKEGERCIDVIHFLLDLPQL